MCPEFVPRPAEGLNYENIVQMAYSRVLRTPQAPAFRYLRDGAWRTISWSQWWSRALQLAQELRDEHGVSAGTHVGLRGRNSIDWVLWDLAISLAGGVSVPIFAESHPEERRHIERGAGCTLVIGSEATAPEIPIASASATPFRADDGPVSPPLALAAGLESPWSVVYTSGTTGAPKGVVLAHRNIVHQAWALRCVLAFEAGDEQLLVLPLAHIFGRHLLWAAVEQGMVTALPDEAGSLVEHLVELAPTCFAGVPRMFEQLRQRMLAEVAGPNRFTRRAFEAALEVGTEARRLREQAQRYPTGLAVRLAVAERTFLGRARALLGSRLRFATTGGGAAPPDLLDFFHACGVLLLEGYGLSETTGAIAVNRPNRFRVGSAGPPVPGCEVRIAEDGEILVRGHQVMSHYREATAASSEPFAGEGWLKTGDLGELRDGFLWVHGSKRDRVRTATGLEVAPGPIERAFERAPEIAHAVVFATAGGELAALLALEEPQVGGWGAEEGILGVDYADLAAHPRVRDRLSQRLREVNATLPESAQIRGVITARRPFSVRGGELTPAYKVRRDALIAQSVHPGKVPFDID